MKNLYLILTIAGAVVPYLFFFQFFAEMGVDLPAFVAALFANGAAGGFTADLLITSLVFWIYIFNRKGGPVPWPFFLLNCDENDGGMVIQAVQGLRVQSDCYAFLVEKSVSCFGHERVGRCLPFVGSLESCRCRDRNELKSPMGLPSVLTGGLP